ncbi:MAG: sugar phosphate isomerase/epimerase family protein [Bacillota bacterium]
MHKFVISGFADEIADDLDAQLNVLESLDIFYIEMRGVNGKPLVHHTTDEARAIKKKLDARGFKISAIGSPLGKIKITDPFPPHLDLFKHTLEIARILETEYIRIFSFYMPQGEDPSGYRDAVMERWSSFIREAQGSNLILAHENEKDIYGDTPERCLDLLQTMNCPYFKAVFDPANFIQCDVETYPKAYEMLKGHLAYLHIKDALYRDHSVTPAGHGDGKIERILEDLRRRNFEGFLSLEPHLGSFTGLSAIDPHSEINRLPAGGPQKFAIAADALRKLLKKIAN